MNTNLLILLIAGGVLAWKLGLLKDIMPTPPGNGGGDGLTEDKAALIVARNRPDICQNLRAFSGGFWNCDTEANTIGTIKEWFYKVDPAMVPEFGTIVNYVKKMGWK